MRRRLKQLAVALVMVLAAAQLIRPARANPPVDVNRTIDAHLGRTSAVSAVLNRACRDCHSNQTVWPWYTQVAPLSWLMSYGVTHGRRAVNFSEWSSYQPERQRQLLIESCRDARVGKMPGAYALLRRDTRLSADDVATICAAAAQRPAQTSAGL
jgi:heme-binding protein